MTSNADAGRIGPLRDILVAGGGLTAWCAAAALRRHAPFATVTVLACPPDPDALADRIASTLPSLRGFHADLGIGDGDAVIRTGSGYRLGTLFEGWSRTARAYVHAHGGHGQSPGAGAGAFHLHWVRAALAGRIEPFDAFSGAAALARSGRVSPPKAARAQPPGPFDGHEAGLSLDVARHTAMMRAYALHHGAREIAGTPARVLSDGGRIVAVELLDGRSLEGDLYVDATGPAALLRSALPGERDDWSRWLPCDRVWLADGPTAEEPPLLERATALAAGWRWSGGSPGRVHHGIAWSSAHASEGKAARQLRVATGIEPTGAPARVAAGTSHDPWNGNCIAIGDAATQIEPLEWCNLHLALSGIDRLISMLPDRDVARVEAAEFNRQALAEAERVRDFQALHYVTAGRGEPMWRALAATEPPASLAHTLAQFRERGRLPFYEEETFARDGWLAVLLGQGVLPRRVDPLADAFPAARARAAMAAWRAAIEDGIATFPTHAAFLAAQTRHAVP